MPSAATECHRPVADIWKTAARIRLLGAARKCAILVLTDGEIMDEEACRQVARQAARETTPITIVGVGAEWNASMANEVAGLTGGKCYSIDHHQSQAAVGIIQQEFERLDAIGFTDVEMHLRLVKDVKITRVHSVGRDVKELKVEERGNRHVVISLGTLGKQEKNSYLVDLSLPKRPDGKYAIARLEIAYRFARSGGFHKTREVLWLPCTPLKGMASGLLRPSNAWIG